jgi:D-glycero-alpha-D-manno-heptose-7-phosphate kinase
MIFCRTPYRISLFGGGTDYPAWYRNNGGSVLSTTINKYSYITCRNLPPFFDYKYRIRYYQREETRTIDEIQHPSVRECLRFIGVSEGIDIVHHGDLPAQSGLGSSSTFTVGLLHALSAMKHEMWSKQELALSAIKIEQDYIGENVGSQDQTAAAFGGLNRIDFGGPNEVTVSPLILHPTKLKSLEDHQMLFFTGFSRSASNIAEEQIKNIPEKTNNLNQMKQLVDEAINILQKKEIKLEDLGCLLNEQWIIKQNMSSKITNPNINAIYKAGMNAGALGGKLLGAGGGGFILFLVKPELQKQIRKKLEHLLYVPIKFEQLGSQIIYYSHEDEY